MRLMCENAKKYNDDGSRIFNDAVAILVSAQLFAILDSLLIYPCRMSLEVWRRLRRLEVIPNSKVAGVNLSLAKGRKSR